MLSDHLSILNPNYSHGCHPLTLRNYFEQHFHNEDFNSRFPTRIEKPPIKHPVACSRRRVLEDLLGKIAKSGIPGEEHVREYLRHKYRRNCKSQTLRSACIALQLFLSFYKNSGKTHLEHLTRQDLEAFVEHEQDRGLKPASVRTRLCALYAFASFLVENKVAYHDVLARKIRVKLPDLLPRAIDPEDLNALLGVVDKVRDRAMILLLLRSGMRIGELLNAKAVDVDLEEQKIMIYEAEKTGVGRVVYFSSDAQEALIIWMRKRNPFKERIFYGRSRDSLCYESARAIFNRYLRKAGLSHKGYTLHCLRHTYASELLNAGMHLECLQVLLGHTNLEVTRRYARLTDKTREEEYFKAMRIIERGEIDGHYQLDH